MNDVRGYLLVEQYTVCAQIIQLQCKSPGRYMYEYAHTPQIRLLANMNMASPEFCCLRELCLFRHTATLTYGNPLLTICRKLAGIRLVDVSVCV
jgi:hypothetical protein